MMGDQRFFASRWMTGILALGALGFVVLSGVLIVVQPFTAVIAALGLGFFGLCLVIALWRLFDPRPVAEITGQGVKIWQYPLVPWAELTDVQVIRFQGQMMIVLSVADPETFIASLSAPRRALARANAALVPGQVFLAANVLRDEPQVITAAIRERWQQEA
ncbi:hypothetical protein IV417_01900 [Alphaproteobacteria bacterium KMM 3653]|uniref:PH domain-containing protein n=1 Tax=Harenicola maris TaxID=2841044 RepID=A0AAP2G6B5_9RHOB|nr:hypothetical protein [Harenicola maris]